MKTIEAEIHNFYLFFDLLILNMAIYLTACFNNMVTVNLYHDLGMYLWIGNLVLLMVSIIFAPKRFYTNDHFRTRFRRINRRVLIFLAVSAIIIQIDISQHYSASFVLESALLFWMGEIFFYWMLFKLLFYKRLKGFNTKRVLVVGINNTSRHLRKLIDSNPILGYKFIGYSSSMNIDDPDSLGHTKYLPMLLMEHKIQVVIVVMPVFSLGKKVVDYLEICNLHGVKLRLVSENLNCIGKRKNSESIGNLLMMNPQEIPLDHLLFRLQKRTFDLVVSSLVIVFILSWLIPLMALLIKLSSKGPVFFIQDRTGIDNQTFRCIKFRSMNQNKLADVKQATANDPRITRIGRFLRSSNLDEMPQFLNVFRGNMSIIGPRPHMLKHTDQYSNLIKYYLIRHSIKPGITGLAQISGFRGETRELWRMEKRVEKDIDYIENWSFTNDLKIMWQTVFGIRGINAMQLQVDSTPKVEVKEDRKREEASMEYSV